MKAFSSAATLPVLVALFAPACGGPRQVSQSPTGAFEASLSATPDGFAVAWYDTRDGNAEIYARLVDVRGRPRSPELRLTHTPEASYEADVRAAYENLAVAWYEKSAGGALTARLGLWTREGRELWTRTISSHGRSGRNPLVRVGEGELFCAWLEDAEGETSELWAGWWDLAGHPAQAARRVAPAGRTTWNLNAALDREGRAWVVFDAKAETRREELFLARIDKTADTVVRLTADDGSSSKYPDLAFGSDRIAVTWFDVRDGNEEVYLSVAEPGALREGSFEARARRVTETAGESIGAYVGWNGQRFGLAWNDDTGGQSEIYFRSFDPAGTPLGSAERITYTRTASSIPAIQQLGDGFALVWTEHTSTPSTGHESNTRAEIVFFPIR